MRSRLIAGTHGFLRVGKPTLSARDLADHRNCHTRHQCCNSIFSYVCWVKIVKGPCHAFRIQKPPSGGLFSSRLDWANSSDASPRPNLSDRLRHPAVFVRWVAGLDAMRSRAGRVHPAHHTLAGGAAAADLALPHGCVLRWSCQVAPNRPYLRCPIWWFSNPTKLLNPALRSGSRGWRNARAERLRRCLGEPRAG